MPGPMGGGMRGPGRRMQGGKRIENPGKVFKRLMAYIFKNYAIHFIFVLICIVLSVVASIQGTLFMQRLIDVRLLFPSAEFSSICRLPWKPHGLHSPFAPCSAALPLRWISGF
jgi:hypothetical protein